VSEREHERHAQEVAEQGEQQRSGPRVYVASLSDYNAGRLHGDWLEAAQEPEELQDQVAAMLARSSEPVAEEWAIHDYEGFGPVRLGEYESLELVSRLGLGIAAHGEAFAALAYVVDNEPEHLAGFEAVYVGQWESLEAYAEDVLDDMGATAELVHIPEWLQPYVALDVAGFARDLEMSGDVLTASANDGGVFVFQGHYS